MNDQKFLARMGWPKKTLTTIAGLFANIQTPWFKNKLITAFIKHFNVNMKDALIEDIQNFKTFNDFFTRALKPGIRPIANSDMVSPADGILSEFGNIQKGQLIQAKNHKYAIEDLLQMNAEQAEPFKQGHYATIYLSPKDYHRLHMPTDGKVLSMTYVPGQLFSVSPKTAQKIPNLFAQNERLIVTFQANKGRFIMVLVGATIVGRIKTVWETNLSRQKKLHHYDYGNHGQFLTKGSEMGRFELGSTIILITDNSQCTQFSKHLFQGMPIQLGHELGMFT